jgi:phytoene/squalene synthetase
VGCGADLHDLTANRMTEGWRCALRDVAGRTRECFTEGRAVCNGVSGRLRYELRLTWLGGATILERLERSNFDVFAQRPALAKADAFPLGLRLLGWKFK